MDINFTKPDRTFGNFIWLKRETYDSVAAVFKPQYFPDVVAAALERYLHNVDEDPGVFDKSCYTDQYIRQIEEWCQDSPWDDEDD